MSEGEMGSEERERDQERKRKRLRDGDVGVAAVIKGTTGHLTVSLQQGNTL